MYKMINHARHAGEHMGAKFSSFLSLSDPSEELSVGAFFDLSTERYQKGGLGNITKAHPRMVVLHPEVLG